LCSTRNQTFENTRGKFHCLLNYLSTIFDVYLPLAVVAVIKYMPDGPSIFSSISLFVCAEYSFTLAPIIFVTIISASSSLLEIMFIVKVPLLGLGYKLSSGDTEFAIGSTCKLQLPAALTDIVCVDVADPQVFVTV